MALPSLSSFIASAPTAISSFHPWSVPYPPPLSTFCAGCDDGSLPPSSTLGLPYPASFKPMSHPWISSVLMPEPTVTSCRVFGLGYCPTGVCEGPTDVTVCEGPVETAMSQTMGASRSSKVTVTGAPSATSLSGAQQKAVPDGSGELQNSADGFAVTKSGLLVGALIIGAFLL